MTNTPRLSLKQHLRQMDDYEFEKLVAVLWAKQGWETRVTQKSDDKGKDVIATKQDPIPHKQIIQVKRHKKGNKVGRPAVQQYSSHLHEDDVDSVVLVTTSSFTSKAKRAAKNYDVKLVDGRDVCDLMEELIEQERTQNHPNFSAQEYVGVDRIHDKTDFPAQYKRDDQSTTDESGPTSSAPSAESDGDTKSERSVDCQTKSNDRTTTDSENTSYTSRHSSSSSELWKLLGTGVLTLLIAVFIVIPRNLIAAYFYGGSAFQPNDYIVPAFGNYVFLALAFLMLIAVRHGDSDDFDSTQFKSEYTEYVAIMFFTYYVFFFLPAAVWKVLSGIIPFL